MKRIFVILTVLSVLTASFVFAPTASAATDEFMCSYSTIAQDGDYYARFGSTSLIRLTEDEAAEQGIPAGYTGDVLIADNTAAHSIDVLLDFSALHISTNAIETLTFRVYVGDDGTSNDSYPEVRIKERGVDGWVMQYSAKNATNQWHNVTLGADGTNFKSGYGFEDLSTDGYLDKFALMLRVQANAAFYIDSITYTLVEDSEAPVITYDGATDVQWFEGAKFALPITAHDNVEGEVALQYLWSDPTAVNPDGTIKRGSYTLTVKATDCRGNEASLTLNVNVGEADTEAPVILPAVDVIRAVTGTRPTLKPTVTDNSSMVDVTAAWSVGALDRAGLLVGGTHTYTVTATDPTGNRTVKVYTVVVTNAEPWAEEQNGNNQSNQNNQNNQNSQNNQNNQNNQNSNTQPTPPSDTNEPTQTTPPAENGGDRLWIGVLIGVAGGAALTLGILAVIYACKKRRV